MNSKFVFKAEKCLIRALNFDDVKSISELADNKKIWDNVSDEFPHPYTDIHGLEFVKAVSKISPPLHFAIEFENQAIGVISIEPRKGMHRIKAEIGYWIGEPFWGKGISTDAIKLILHYGFNYLNLEKIEARTFEYNKASEKALLNAGFRNICIFHNDALKNNRLIDINYLAILKEEYLNNNLIYNNQ
jgi:RimJ/RimL family protein N-acetyltransferase